MYQRDLRIFKLKVYGSVLKGTMIWYHDVLFDGMGQKSSNLLWESRLESMSEVVLEMRTKVYQSYPIVLNLVPSFLSDNKRVFMNYEI